MSRLAPIKLASPDDSNFAPADYGATGTSSNPTFNGQYAMQGWAGEYWFDISGFANYVAGESSILTGAAPNIAAGLNQRFAGCKLLKAKMLFEPDDLDGYTNRSNTGVASEDGSGNLPRLIALGLNAGLLMTFMPTVWQRSRRTTHLTSRLMNPCLTV